MVRNIFGVPGELLPLELFQARQVSVEAAGPDVVEYRRGGARALRAATAHRKLRLPRGTTLPLYVPGWWNSPSDEAARALVSALLRHHPAVLVLDTRRSFGRGYLSAAARVASVSHALYSLIEKLATVGVSPEDIHVIGFSLGAHVAGMAGRLVRERLDAPLGRITALDPARPCFTRSAHRLRRSDADFVQVIHSSAGVLGLEEPVGHADVYVNGVAVRQPECATRGGTGVECDHNAAWRVFAASARDKGALQARRCAAWQDVQRAQCAGERELLGYPCTTSARGMYLFKSDSGQGS